MIFEARKHLESLQAVNAELLEEIVSRRERSRGQLKMLCSQVEDFLCGLFQRAHRKVNLSFLHEERKFFTRRCYANVALWRAVLEHDQAAANASRNSFGSSGGAELAQNRGYVKFHSVIGDCQTRGNFLSGESRGQHLKHFAL